MTTQLRASYDIHTRSNRMAIANGSPSKSAFVLGSYAIMMKSIGLPTSELLFKEVEVSVILSSTFPRDIGYNRVQFASTTLGADSDKMLIAELSAIHDFNRWYYHQARVFGGNYEHIPVLPHRPDRTRNPLEQDSGVTTEFLHEVFAHGSDIFVDRNDYRIASLTNHGALTQATIDLNDKNFYYRLLLKYGVRFARPQSILIDELKSEVLDELLAYDEKQVLGFFSTLMLQSASRIPHHGVFHPEINYFIKVSGGAGGNSVESSICRLHGEQSGKDFLAILGTIKRRMLIGAPNRGLQLQAPIPIKEPGTTGSLDTQYRSPCLTLRIGRDGYELGHVGEQILAHDASCAGTYWHKELSDEFAKRHKDSIESLARAIISTGYVGNFGTDFVRDTNGIYQMIVDGNARINADDILRSVVFPLMLQGVKVFDAHMAFVEFEADQASFSTTLKELFGELQYSHLRYGGVVLMPKFKSDTLLGKGHKRSVCAIYVNPSQDDDRYDTFLKLI